MAEPLSHVSDKMQRVYLLSIQTGRLRSPGQPELHNEIVSKGEKKGEAWGVGEEIAFSGETLKAILLF